LKRLSSAGWRACGIAACAVGPAAAARDFCLQNYSINRGNLTAFACQRA
jgi:hypothetical protein